jgi:hypothetical protein
MFPNVRLMIVAISASLLAIVCAMTLFMGMFAAFGVAHEPLSALTAGRPPLQIAFADESSAPVADGKPAPFGVRFRLNAPQVPNGPVIVAVPAALDRGPQDAPPAAEPGARPEAESASTKLQNDAAQSPSPDAQTNDAGPTAKTGDTKTNETKPDDANKDDVTAAVTAPARPAASERPAVLLAPQPIAPEIRIVAREAENPASVSTQPAPTLARKTIKRRKLAIRLHQLHHFRRPRIHPIAANQTPGYLQPNGFGQPSGLSQPNVNGFAQPNAYAQPGFQFSPVAIKPRPVKFRHAARNGSSASQ